MYCSKGASTQPKGTRKTPSKHRTFAEQRASYSELNEVEFETGDTEVEALSNPVANGSTF
jgi:hypothetical protein